MKTSCRSLELLRQAMIKNDTIVCCGLDPDVSKMPAEVRDEVSDANTVRSFLKIVIDLTAPYVCAYKAQKAFFDIHPDGHRLLKEIIQYVHERHPYLPVFVDAKIGDVRNTMDVYLANIINDLGADGVVVNPYLGDDVLRPFERLPDKAVIVTVKTSNPGAAIIQDAVLHDGRPLWKYVLELTVNRWNAAGNIVPVIASTADIDLREVREAVPDDMPILFAGYGSQGGRADQLRDLIDSTSRGVFVNSSRGILYPYEVDDPDWREAIVQATVSMKDHLNFSRSRSKFLLILGVSGVGKSVIIRELRNLDSRFVYISPYMTRTLRSGEADKVPIDDLTLNKMEHDQMLLATNELYGVRYATPRGPIERAFREERFPLLDWPIDRLEIMQQAFPGRLFRVYLEPPNIDSLRRRLADGRDPIDQRLHAATAELATLATGSYDKVIDYRAVSLEGEIAAIAREIYQAYLKATGL